MSRKNVFELEAISLLLLKNF